MFTRFFLERKGLLITIVLFALFLFFLNPFFLQALDLGKEKVLSSSPCLYKATYNKGKDYDVAPFIKELEIKYLQKNKFQFTLEIPKLRDGDYYTLSLYQKGDAKNKPIKDLSHQPADRFIDGSIAIYFKVFEVKSKFFLAPVIYKKGYRGKDAQKKSIYLDVFPQNKPIVTDLDGKKVGDPGNMFTYLMASNAGKGIRRVSKHDGLLPLNSKGQFEFLLNLNADKKDSWSFIIGFTKIRMMKSRRGLRSPMRTKFFSLQEQCKK